LVGEDPGFLASAFAADAFELLDEGTRDTMASRLVHDADLVEEELRPLVRMEHLDRREKASRPVVEVAEEENVSFVSEEPPSLRVQHLVVEGGFETRDLALVAG